MEITEKNIYKLINHNIKVEKVNNFLTYPRSFHCQLFLVSTILQFIFLTR
jgi:hypothetical protein